MVKTLLALFLALPGASQPVVLAEFCGVNNEADPAAVKTCESPDAINVESDKNGTTLRKRKGTTPFLTLAAGTAVNSIFALKNNSGNECLIIANNTGTLYRSINSGSAVSFSTITSGARLYCQSDNGKAYCFTSSNDTPFSYDCATYYAEQQANGYPNGKFNVFTQDRQLIAGTTDFPNRLHISQAGAVSTYTGGTDEISSWTEDIGRSGDKITGAFYVNGRVIVFKEYSIGGFNVTDQFNSTYYDISSRVGIVGPESALVHDGHIYFKGSDNEFYRMTGAPGDIEKLSRKLRRTVASVLTGKTRYIILTDKPDWDAGNYNGQGPLAAMSGEITFGSVMPSSLTAVDTSSSDWTGTKTNVVLTDQIGSVTLSSTTFKDYFSDGDLTSNPPWTSLTGNFQVSGGELYANTGFGAGETFHSMRTPLSISSGSWIFSHRFTDSLSDSCGGSEASGYYCFDFRINANYSGQYYSIRLINTSGAESLKIIKESGTGETTLADASISYSETNSHSWEITRSTIGNISVRIDGVFISSATDVAISSNAYLYIGAYSADNGNPSVNPKINNYFDTIYAYEYRTGGSIISRIFDTGFSTPMAGPLSSTATFTNHETAVYFDVRNSTSPNDDLWTSYVASSDTLNVGLTKRYWQYRARFWTQVSTKTPSLDAISLAATTTGQYITSCIEPGTGITAWGALELGGVFAGSGTNFTVENSTGSSCSDPSIGNSWAITSTGTTISTETAAAYKVRVTFNIGSTSDTARMDSLTVNWTEGSVAPPSYLSYWDDGIYFAISTGTTGNNRTVKYDLRSGSLWPFDIGMNSPVTFNNIMYFGSTSTAKVMKYSANDPDSAPNADDGSAINGYWRSKQLTAQDPFTEKALERVSIIAKKEAAGTLDTSWRINGNTNSGSFTVNLSTGQALIRHNYRVPVGQVGASYDVRVGNNSVYPFEVLGLKLDLSPKEWRPLP